MIGDVLRIDEAMVDGSPAPVKTEGSDASAFIPPDLQIEMRSWLECLGRDTRGCLLPAPKVDSRQRESGSPGLRGRADWHSGKSI
jgi:hypothetical protein